MNNKKYKQVTHGKALETGFWNPSEWLIRKNEFCDIRKFPAYCKCLTWLCWWEGCQWRGTYASPESADQSSAEHTHGQ